MILLDTAFTQFRLIGDGGTFQSSLEITPCETGVFLLRVRIRSDRKAYPPVYRLEWSYPSVDIQSLWHPGINQSHCLQADWGEGFFSRNTSLAPIFCLKNGQDRNKLTFAFSDAIHCIYLKAGLHEENSTFLCSLTLFEEQTTKIDRYDAVLRIDLRNIPYYDAIRDVGTWWESVLAIVPLPVPDCAMRPMYSTWYSFHQQFTAADLERQCERAKSIGCESVIVDDGWQTSDHNRGYAFTGDWEVSREKIGDMKRHVAQIHRYGLKYILWFSVPFIGEKSKAWQTFHRKFLTVNKELRAGVLDPRFPEVREYLIGIYEHAIAEWDIDGLKLDFVDSFQVEQGTELKCGEGRDYDTLPEAVDALFAEMILRLRAIKPNILIEFRQTYIGPLMRKYCNMFRACDCPNDMVQNRIRTLDLRLMSGNTAVHSDMIMFHPEESIENAALQLINVIFSVPQISVLLRETEDAYMRMLRFWLSFCTENRDVLLLGHIAPCHPELAYPVVEASAKGKRIIAVYSSFFVTITDTQAAQIILINGTQDNAVVVQIPESLGTFELEVDDCLGRPDRKIPYTLTAGLHRVPVPRSGLAVFRRV